MADLKTTIAQTENLKNKVKLAKDRINETVVRGGITSKSLSEIPDNINKMLGQYKKIAIIKKRINFTGQTTRLTVPLNLDFLPERLLIHRLEEGGVGVSPSYSPFINYINSYIDSGYKKYTSIHLNIRGYSQGYNFYFKLNTFDKDKIILNAAAVDYKDSTACECDLEIIAIG